MKKLHFVTLCILCGVVFISCKDLSTNVFTDNSEPGRRDYVWTILDSTGNNLSLYKIWGDSPDNIWIGKGFSTNPKERLWHYDGIRLQAVCDEAVYPNCMFGFGNNNVMVASNWDIWKYDGAGWNKIFTFANFEFSPYISATINDINGYAPNDLWAVGTACDKSGTVTDGLIYKNTGEGFVKKFQSSYKNAIFSQVFPGYNKDQCFIWGLRINYNPDTYSSTVWEYKGNKLKEIYTGSWYDPDKGCSLNKINGIIYITIGQKIYRYFNEQLTEYITVADPDFLLGVLGRNEKDLFLWSPYGLMHYNGTDIKYVFKPGYPVSVTDKILFFDKEIYFFYQNDNNGKYYLVKGVLPDKK